MGHEIDRRQLLGLGLAGGAAALGVPLLAGSDSPARAAAPRTDPVSMAMHIHSSWSEGAGSMQAQLHQAQRLGVDVLWWTEHDFRVTARGYRQAVHFDGRREAENGDEWVWSDATAGPVTGAAGRFVTDRHSPDEAGSALRLQVTGPSADWGSLTWTGTAWNHTYTTSIVDTTLVLDVLGEQLGKDAQLVVEVLSSYRPGTGGRPAGQYALQYRVGQGGQPWLEGDGLTGVVPVASTGSWQRLQMTLADDMAALWPDLVRGDAGLVTFSVGVRARRGATAQAVVDRLRFHRADRDNALGLQAAMMKEYASRYPAVRQHQASELSLVLHLNTFGGQQVLPDYPQAGAHKDDSVSAARAMVRWAQAHGGLVSYNHPLDGLANRAELAKVLVTTGSLGADALEVGCPRSLDDIAWAYDVAARNSVFVTATGVSDDHSGKAWETRTARWVTSVWAGSLQQADLLSAVGSGRAWFWDLAGWGGTLDLKVDGQPGMGGVLVTGQRRTSVQVQATDVPTGGSVDIVVGAVDNAGTADLRPSISVQTAAVGSRTVDVAPGSYVRAVVRDRRGTVVGFSNPAWVLRTAPPGGVPVGRRL